MEGWNEPYPPHLALLNDALVKVAQGKIRRLLVEMPPRHGKSETCSRFFPAWYLLKNPKGRVILTSYGTDYARTWGRKARRVLEEHKPASIRTDASASSDWETTEGGGMVTAGIGTGITGRGADILIIDDPVKDQEEAASVVIQERNWDWYQSTARTRLEPGGAVVLIQTRWHENDLAGRILKEEGHEWTRISLPALADGTNDLLGRVSGMALWPERFNRAALDDIREGRFDEATGERHGGISAYWWSALYQQSPTPETGNIFKRGYWRRYPSTRVPIGLGATFVDVAHDEKTSGDYCVLATWIATGLDFYLVRLVRAQMQFPELLQACMDARLANGLPLVIEDTSGSKPLIQSLQRTIPGVLPFKLEGRSKVARAQAASPYAEAGNCYLPLHESWVGDFIEEHAAFPNGSHDDMVDTTSMAMIWFANHQAQPEERSGHAVHYTNGHSSNLRPLKAGRA